MNIHKLKVPPSEGFREADYSKFKEWLLLKRYSGATIKTTVTAIEYFRIWAVGENIYELSEVSYQDAMLFMQWVSKGGASQKTIANYLGHVRKYYQFLISEGEAKENPVAHIKVQGIKRKVYYDILSVEALHKLYNDYPTTITSESGKGLPPQAKNILSRKRNKVILGLLIYQGLRVEEIAALDVQDLQLRDGKITIHSQRTTAARIMVLESHQVYELMDYVHETRKAFLQPNQITTKLFITRNNGAKFYNITSVLLQVLRKINSSIKNVEQIRASVITAWLKQYDVRKVQYLAGHKYVSSTENYKANVIDELQNDVTKYHPFG
jgi:site-specific recombinase XerD